MTDLRKLAQGQPCMIRCPTACNGDPNTTVLCHIRMSGLSGMGFKAPDAFATFGCSDCHAVCDGQQASSYSSSERRLMLLEGMLRTHQWMLEHGISPYQEARSSKPKSLSKIVPRRLPG